jgi:hypothetical protein
MKTPVDDCLVFMYILSESLRPARTTGRIDRLKLVIDNDSDFECRFLQFSQVHDYFLRCNHPEMGVFSEAKVRIDHVWGPGFPIPLHKPLVLKRKEIIEFEIENSLSKGRNWNKIQIAFQGYKVF